MGFSPFIFIKYLLFCIPFNGMLLLLMGIKLINIGGLFYLVGVVFFIKGLTNLIIRKNKTKIPCNMAHNGYHCFNFALLSSL
jgi:predicted membrane channel-forming protein YqfA (hemolysin III family)